MLRLTNLEQRNTADVIEESVQSNLLNEVRKQLPKFLPKDHPEDREGEKKRKRRRKDAGGSSSKKSTDQEEYLYFKRGDDVEEPTPLMKRQDKMFILKKFLVRRILVDFTNIKMNFQYKVGSMSLSMLRKNQKSMSIKMAL
uniref:Uncharacterized protein n=1 Tax=Tanacetum cinerariifolium TaxID=118510 RepID=A0A6L2JQI1_TANCI|nr:hypothetical protein [Tanacetum cinerariifolium]